MIKITIEGPQGSGKTRVANAIKQMLEVAGKQVVIVNETIAPEPKGADVIIFDIES